jgi:hypothetical protein
MVTLGKVGETNCSQCNTLVMKILRITIGLGFALSLGFGVALGVGVAEGEGVAVGDGVDIGVPGVALGGTGVIGKI